MSSDAAMQTNTASAAAAHLQTGWQQIDRELRSIARRQRSLDAEEAVLLCIVSRDETWRHFGCATLLEYLERIFGYGPKVGHERVRVALALDEMTELREALESSEVSYSALRELTRVVTVPTQGEWLDAVRGKTVRQVEDLVRTHRKGDLPTDPADPDLKPRRLQFEVSPATYALLRQARQLLAESCGRFVEDDELVAAMAAALMERPAADTVPDDEGRSKYQVRVTTCESCSQAYFEGGGRKIAVADSDRARAECDAQRIGADERAAQDIAPKTRRAVHHRDGGGCTIPGCRSARFIEVHHIVAREDGGSHDASNLTLLCDGHHKSLHDGKLVLSGIAPDVVARFVNEPITNRSHVRASSTTPPNDSTESTAKATHAPSRHGTTRLVTSDPHVETSAEAPAAKTTRETFVELPTAKVTLPSRHTAAVRATVENSAYQVAVMRAEAKQALRQLQFSPAESSKFVEAALATEPKPSTLEQLIRVALRCSR
jgi:5-methylcytosine-specific restriction endonuclease McrA